MQDVFSFFSTQDDQGRIAILPSYTFWNWRYRNWGHIGSGFLWYGIEQPLLDRAFDPWSFYNEQFYYFEGRGGIIFIFFHPKF